MRKEYDSLINSYKCLPEWLAQVCTSSLLRYYSLASIPLLSL